MTRTFEQHVEHWLTLKNNNIPGVSTTSQAKEAATYYNDYIFDVVLNKTRQHYQQHYNPPQVEVLVSLVGYSPQTTINAAYTLRPEHLVLIHSQESHQNLDSIYDQLTQRRHVLHQDQIHPYLCQVTDPTNMLHIVQEAIEDIQCNTAHGQNYIDITGGKKVMSASAALIAWQLDLNICYINTQYDPHHRQPKPGTEHLIELGNPNNLFGTKTESKI